MQVLSKSHSLSCVTPREEKTPLGTLTDKWQMFSDRYFRLWVNRVCNVVCVTLIIASPYYSQKAVHLISLTAPFSIINQRLLSPRSASSIINTFLWRDLAVFSFTINWIEIGCQTQHLSWHVTLSLNYVSGFHLSILWKKTYFIVLSDTYYWWIAWTI